MEMLTKFFLQAAAATGAEATELAADEESVLLVTGSEVSVVPLQLEIGEVGGAFVPEGGVDGVTAVAIVCFCTGAPDLVSSDTLAPVAVLAFSIVPFC